MHRNAYRLLAFSHEMERQGREPRSRLLAREIRRATDAEAAQLRIESGSPIAEIRRVRLADEIPMVVENAIIAHEGADVVMQVDLEAGSMHDALSKAGVHLRRGHASITAEPASQEDANLLGVNLGDPLLIERRVIFDLRGRGVEVTESRYAGNRYGLDVRFDVEGTSTRRKRRAGPSA